MLHIHLLSFCVSQFKPYRSMSRQTLTSITLNMEHKCLQSYTHGFHQILLLSTNAFEAMQPQYTARDKVH